MKENANKRVYRHFILKQKAGRRNHRWFPFVWELKTDPPMEFS